jgi:LAO/AO transport system kinase
MPPSDAESSAASRLGELAARVGKGEKLAVAAALNLIEDRRRDALPRIEALLSALAAQREPEFGHRVGLTGPPGVGKSTLTAALTREYRARGHSVGVLAVDPSSVRSGGALLGDRARMAFDPEDAGIFVRSLATAGEAGGLAQAANAGVEVLAAAYDRVLVETTGVGQSETDVEHVVDTVCLVIQPGSGDVLQFIKAGIMEIPDVIVVNKGDHGRLAQRAAADLAGALDRLRQAGMGDEGDSFKRPVLVTSARDRQGIEPLIDTFEAHLSALGGAAVRERRARGELAWARALFARRYGEHGVSTLGGKDSLSEKLAHAIEEGASPLGAAARVGETYLREIRSKGGPTS